MAAIGADSVKRVQKSEKSMFNFLPFFFFYPFFCVSFWSGLTVLN